MNLKEALEVLFGENPKRVRILSGEFDSEVLLPAIVGVGVDIVPIDEIRGAEFAVIEEEEIYVPESLMQAEDRLHREDKHE